MCTQTDEDPEEQEDSAPDDERTLYGPTDLDEQRRAWVLEINIDLSHSINTYDFVHFLDAVDKWLKDGTVVPDTEKKKDKRPVMQLIQKE